MKKIAILFMVLITMPTLQSQTVVKNPAQLQVESAVKDGLFIIMQNYCLADSDGNMYGRNNAEYFGSIMSLGVIAGKGYFMQEKAVSPQNYDVNYNGYSDYSVVLRKTHYRSLDNKEFYVLPFSKEKIDTVAAGSLYYMKDDVMGVNGFSFDSTFGEKDGWLVWVVTDSLSVDNMNLELISYKAKKTFQENENVIEIDAPMTRKNVLGGIFVCPVIKDIGIIQYKLTGILCPRGDKWIIAMVKSGVGGALSSTEVPSEHGASVGPASEGLTPIEDNSDRTGKKKKRRR